jgi:hypothetical protein
MNDLDMEKVGALLRPLIGAGATVLGGKALLNMFKGPKSRKQNAIDTKWDYAFDNTPWAGRKLDDNVIAMNPNMPTHFKSVMSFYSPKQRAAMFDTGMTKYKYALNQDDLDAYGVGSGGMRNTREHPVWNEIKEDSVDAIRNSRAKRAVKDIKEKSLAPLPSTGL